MAFDLPDLDAELDAGVTYSYRLSARKTFALDPSEWMAEYSRFNLRADTAWPYPKTLFLTDDARLVEFLFQEGDALEEDVTYTPQPAVDGDFRMKLTLALVKLDWGYCVVNAELDRGLIVRSETPDMIPPLVRDIAFDKPEYRPGETVTVTIRLTEPLKEAATDHLEFANPLLSHEDPSKGFPGYKSNGVYVLTPVDATTYRTSFVIPENAVAGDYFLAWFNRFDAAENFEDQVGEVDEEEMTVSSNKALRIVQP